MLMAGGLNAQEVEQKESKKSSFGNLSKFTVSAVSSAALFIIVDQLHQYKQLRIAALAGVNQDQLNNVKLGYGIGTWLLGLAAVTTLATAWYHLIKYASESRDEYSKKPNKQPNTIQS